MAERTKEEIAKIFSTAGDSIAEINAAKKNVEIYYLNIIHQIRGRYYDFS